jgi:ribonuclease HI
MLGGGAKKPVSHHDLWEQLTGLMEKYEINWHVVSKEEFPPEMVQAKELANTAAHLGERISRR